MFDAINETNIEIAEQNTQRRAAITQLGDAQANINGCLATVIVAAAGGFSAALVGTVPTTGQAPPASRTTPAPAARPRPTERSTAGSAGCARIGRRPPSTGTTSFRSARTLCEGCTRGSGSTSSPSGERG
jgi:hypothetical protein